MDREKIKTVIGGAAAGAVLAAVVGFGWGGWVTGSKAETMAADGAVEAVVARLAPICVSQYGSDPDKMRKHEALMAIKSWNRAEYVAEQGWATMVGEENADSRVSRRCAEMISELKS